jgi:hypothetical protein
MKFTDEQVKKIKEVEAITNDILAKNEGTNWTLIGFGLFFITCCVMMVLSCCSAKTASDTRQTDTPVVQAEPRLKIVGSTDGIRNGGYMTVVQDTKTGMEYTFHNDKIIAIDGQYLDGRKTELKLESSNGQEGKEGSAPTLP